MFANEASLKMLSKSDMLQNQTYILHLVIHFEYVLTNKAAFGGSESHLGLKMRYIGELVGDNNGRNTAVTLCGPREWSQRQLTPSPWSTGLSPLVNWSYIYVFSIILVVCKSISCTLPVSEIKVHKNMRQYLLWVCSQRMHATSKI